MEHQRHDDSLDQGDGMPEPSGLAHGGSYAHHHHHHHHHPDASHVQYFDAGSSLEGDANAAHAITTIPEGATLLSSGLTLSDKSPSPPHSSTTTTGTTTTPTSIGNASGDGLGKGPDYPVDGLTPRAHQDIEAWPDMGQARYGGMTPEHAHLVQQQQQQGQPPRYNPANYPTALKLLVSNNVAGSIIGRGGQTISELQSQSATRIKLSQTGDYYPGTQDRVCLLQGDTENVKVALRLLLERLYVLQEHQHSQHLAWQLQKQRSGGAEAPAFDFVVRLLVPATTCGMIIGKSGSNIKFMEEHMGVTSVRLSPKDSGEAGYPAAAVIAATAERVVTITGASVESCLKCLHHIVDGMSGHPDIGRYTNMTTSYSRVVPDAFGAAPRPVLISLPPTQQPRHSPPEPLWDQGPFAPEATLGLPRRIASSPDLPNVYLNQRRVSQQLMDPPTPERTVSFSAAPPPHHHSPYSPLTQHGGLSAPSNVGAAPLYLLPQPQGPVDQVTSPGMSQHNHFMQQSVSAPDLLALQLEHSMHIAAPPPSTAQLQPEPPTQPPPQDFGNFIPQAPTMISPGCFNAQVLVPESMVGSVLGRQGRTLNELQMLSGARIRISQRGEYMPGTRSRIVSIRGPTAQGVWQAQYLMGQRMVLPPTAAAPPSPTTRPVFSPSSSRASSSAVDNGASATQGDGQS